MAFISEWFWFFLFLPIAALCGWVVGRRGGQRHSESQVSRLSSTYFRGLNYLLNEQPDKAIELFLHIAELDKETFETQLALGHLFRRRGEVDRAIRLHQGLANRQDLSDGQRVQALLALGEDYMKSGLLDRAETVFTDLARIDQRAPQALKHLIGIYQAERDWEKAIENATRYEQVTDEPMGKLIGQFECELAERHRAAGRLDEARAAIERANAADAMSVRAGIIEGRLESDFGNDEGAVRAFGRSGGCACVPGGNGRALPRHRPGAGPVAPDGRTGGGWSRTRLPGAAVEGPPVRARRIGAHRPDSRRGCRSRGDAAGPEAHHRSVAGAQSGLSLHPLRLRRTYPPLAVPQLQGMGDGKAPAELRGALIHAAGMDGSGTVGGRSGRSLVDGHGAWLCAAPATA